jgi:hypothetical protein
MAIYKQEINGTGHYNFTGNQQNGPNATYSPHITNTDSGNNTIHNIADSHNNSSRAMNGNIGARLRDLGIPCLTALR